MSDPEPPASDGHPEGTQSKNGGGSLSRLRTLLRLLRRPRGPRGSRETMDALIAAAALEGVTPITPQERFLIGNILKVHERNAADVMVPRVDIVALDVAQPFAEVVKCMVEHGHSRVPVYRESLDDVIGFVHVKDVLAPVADRRPGRLERLLRKVLFVAPSLPILDLLVQMRQARTHIAMVVDEFGGIDGLVTIEDLIEEIVGEIEDEHDVAEAPTLIERPDGSIIADARLPIEALEDYHGARLRPAGDEEAVDTLGGLVFTLAGRVPKRGEVIAHPDGIEFEVLDADPRRVKRLRVRGAAAGNGSKGMARA
jgi:hemolysin (HlyC) family protein